VAKALALSHFLSLSIQQPQVPLVLSNHAEAGNEPVPADDGKFLMPPF